MRLSSADAATLVVARSHLERYAFGSILATLPPTVGSRSRRAAQGTSNEHGGQWSRGGLGRSSSLKAPGRLRSDLDRLVTEALIPEREAAAVLRVEGRTQGAVEYRRPTAASYCYKGLGLRFRIAPVLRISHVDRQWDGQPGDALHPFAHEFGG